jgi:hypothetical protein
MPRAAAFTLGALPIQANNPKTSSPTTRMRGSSTLALRDAWAMLHCDRFPTAYQATHYHLLKNVND